MRKAKNGQLEQPLVVTTQITRLERLSSPTSVFSQRPTAYLTGACVGSAAVELAALEPQTDRLSGPLTVTGLVSGCCRAAFRGLTALKRTEDKQPVKPTGPS